MDGSILEYYTGFLKHVLHLGGISSGKPRRVRHPANNARDPAAAERQKTPGETPGQQRT
jgi:hypothetical protein